MYSTYLPYLVGTVVHATDNNELSLLMLHTRLVRSFITRRRRITRVIYWMVEALIGIGTKVDIDREERLARQRERYRERYRATE